jgi:hypothetical protein
MRKPKKLLKNLKTRRRSRKDLKRIKLIFQPSLKSEPVVVLLVEAVVVDLVLTEGIVLLVKKETVLTEGIALLVKKGNVLIERIALLVKKVKVKDLVDTKEIVIEFLLKETHFLILVPQLLLNLLKASRLLDYSRGSDE